MKPVHFLSAEDLTAVSHPLRQRILGLLVERGELSGRQIPELVPDAPANPYYHLDILRRAGLVEIVRTERRRGATEKFYASVARTFSLDPGELVGGEGPEQGRIRTGILTVARNGAESALDDLAGSLEGNRSEGKGAVPFVNLCTLRLSPARAADLQTRMKGWLEDAVEAGVVEPGDDDEEEEGGAKVEYVFYQLFFPRCAG